MRVLLITQGISRVVNPLFQSGHDVVGVIESMPRLYKSKVGYGKAVFSIRNLASRFGMAKATLQQFCKNRNKPYKLVSEFDKEVLDWIKNLAPDLIVVFSMSQLLKEDVLSLPKFGVINLHPSFLPAYRGPNPDFWQYVDGELNPGVTVHFVDKGEDTGDIILQERIDIPLGIRSPERLDKLIGLGSDLLIKAIETIEKGEVVRLSQPKVSSTPRARNIRLDEHNKIINWTTWPVEKIWHLLRGTESWFRPVGTPYWFSKSQYWHVADFSKGVTKNILPGDVSRDGGKYYLHCKDGRIELVRKFSLKLQLIELLK